MRRDRTVTDEVTVWVLSNTWQNLADMLAVSGGKPADGSGLPLPEPSRLCLGLLPHQRAARRRPGGAEIHDRRHEQQGQAAADRIEGERDPHRNRQGKGCGHHQQPHQPGHHDQSSEHVLQPPREEQDQRARPAWQDYGRLWENLRLPERARLQGCTTRKVIGRGIVAGRFSRIAFQPLIAAAPPLWISRRNDLKNNEKNAGFGSPDPSRRWWSGRVAAQRGRDAAIWHKTGGPESQRTPEVTDDCLSFVIPEQQGARVETGEDNR